MGSITGSGMNLDEGFLFEMPPPVEKVAELSFRERNPIWTECKAKLIAKYLFYFVLITKHGTYIDGFAGPQEPDEPEMWAAKLALESKPRWLRKFFFCELDRKKVELLEKMVKEQPPRDKTKSEPPRTVRVLQGDFNKKINEILSENPMLDKEASFCLLDQRTFECDWATVKALATHKNGGNKIELFYFFPEGWLDRSVSGLKDAKACADRWWARTDWETMSQLRGAERATFVAERFKRELGYKYSYPFPIYERKDRGGRVMYYMIHASDHDAATKLMWRAYHKALEIEERPEQLDLLKEQLGEAAP